MKSTPETDALVDAINADEKRHEFDFVEMTKHARKLERERNEAREQIKYNLETTLIIERMLYEAREKSEELRAEIASLRNEIKEALV